MFKLNGYRNWMQASDGLMGKQLKDIMMPGVHHYDAATLGTEMSACAAKALFLIDKGMHDGPLTKLPDLILRKYIQGNAITQHSSVTQLLNMGARYLDSRNCWDQATGHWRTYHQVYGQYSDQSLQEVRAFLETVERELIIIEVTKGTQAAPGATDPGDEGLLDMIKSVLGDYLYPRPDPDTKVQDLTLGEIIGDRPRVIVLYNSDEFEPVMNERFDDFKEFWPFSSYVDDMYKGTTDPEEMEKYLIERLSDSDEGKLRKLQYILAWGFDATVRFDFTLEDMESSLPDRFPKFFEHAVTNQGRRVNVILVDFYDKMYHNVMQAVFEANGNADLLIGGFVSESRGSIVIGQTYELLAHRTIDYMQRLSLCGFKTQEPNLSVHTDNSSSHTHFMLIPHPTGSDYQFLHLGTGHVIARKKGEKPPFKLVEATKANEDITRFTISMHDASEGLAYMKSYDGNLKCGGFENTDNGAWNAYCNVEETGDAGSNERWFFHPISKPRRMFGSSDKYPIYDGGIYMIFNGEGDETSAISFVGEYGDLRAVLEEGNARSARQHWRVRNLYLGSICLQNMATGTYLHWSGGEGSQLGSSNDDHTENTSYCLRDNDDGVYLACLRDDNDWYVHDKGEDGKPGDTLITHSHSGSDAQQWYFKKVELKN
ncbi:hypothetical protein [Pacificoceanicola onchidii]|uniref:hypothetical protein n=1 Tax=Pacificoceanicola onchidii TaxID=2562685 RepID=UPI0010A5CB9A|nr:hypothetical protein [Pacificoceanicola onchidii]